MEQDMQIAVETLVETERYTIWRAKEPDGELQYHLDMENVTLHFFQEEWDEFLSVMESLLEGGEGRDANRSKPSGKGQHGAQGKPRRP